jgi:hypothetical protein
MGRAATPSPPWLQTGRSGHKGPSKSRGHADLRLVELLVLLTWRLMIETRREGCNISFHWNSTTEAPAKIPAYVSVSHRLVLAVQRSSAHCPGSMLFSLFFPRLTASRAPSMSATSSAAAKRKLRPARKQVKPGEIDKSEGPQPGKEYSGSSFLLSHSAAAVS